MNIETSQATMQDLPRLYELDRECFPPGNVDLEPAPVGEIEEGVVSGCVFIASNQNQIVGMLQIDKASSNQWEILTLAVTASNRGIGVGKALMEKLFLELNKSPYLVAVSCLTSPNNLPMQGLLESFGFVQVGLMENHYGPGKNRLKFLLN